MGQEEKAKQIRSLVLSIELIKNNTTYTRADGIQESFNYREFTNFSSNSNETCVFI